MSTLLAVVTSSVIGEREIPASRVSVTMFAVGQFLLFISGGFGWKLCGRIVIGWIVLGLRFALLFAIITAYPIAVYDTGRSWSWSGEFVPVYSLIAISLAFSMGSAATLWRVEMAGSRPGQ